MGTRLQSIELPAHEDSALCIDLDHEQVAADRRFFAAPYNIDGGDGTLEIAAQFLAAELHRSRSQLHDTTANTATSVARSIAIRSAAISQIILALVDDQGPTNDALCGIKEGDDLINDINGGDRLSLRCDNVAKVAHVPCGIIWATVSEGVGVEVSPSCHTAI